MNSANEIQKTAGDHPAAREHHLLQIDASVPDRPGADRQTKSALARSSQECILPAAHSKADGITALVNCA